MERMQEITPHLTIVWLGDPAGQNKDLVGGKVANLSLLAADHPVPPGFCLTTAAYDCAPGSKFRQNGHAPSAEALPAWLARDLGAAYAGLSRRVGVPQACVAVRSSAVDEDGGVASFAGQHDTFLNIAGASPVLDAVVACWASAQSDMALSYRHQQGLDQTGMKLAVLIQQLVRADVSGVVFSVNPLSGDPNEIVINASWGLGESIVGGTVTPDTVVVQKMDRAVSSYHVATKQRMTVPAPRGTKEVKVPTILQKQPALNSEQAIEMAQLAMELETRMGWPVDIECAWSGGKLYLLQCRPITTLHAADRMESPGEQAVNLDIV
jgi:phosphoenolpyruvate synthase/pyruvate phosphate dikinase